MPKKKGSFNHSDLTVKFGGEFSKPENIFTANAIKVPKYTIVSTERESLGNGWYGGRVKVEREYDRSYIIVHENTIIGWMIPYPQDIKTFLHDIKSAPYEVQKFAREYAKQFLTDIKTYK